MNRKVLLLILVVLFSYSAHSFADPAPEIVPQVIEPYADFLIPQDRTAHIWTDKPEDGWTVLKRKSNRRGFQTFGTVQWLDETHHILRRSFLPVWSQRDAYEDNAITAAVSGGGSLVASQSSDNGIFNNFAKLYWTNTRTGAMRKEFNDIRNPFVFSPNGKFFAANIQNPITDASALSVRSIPDGNNIKEIALAAFPNFILWSNDSKTLVCINGIFSSNSKTMLTMWSADDFHQIRHTEWFGTPTTAFFDSQNDLEVVSQPSDHGAIELRSWKSDGKFYTFHKIDFKPYQSSLMGILPSDTLLLRSDFDNGPNNKFGYYTLDKNDSPRHLIASDLQNPEIENIIKSFANPPSVPLVEDDFARLYSIKTLRVAKGKIYAADTSRVFNVLDGYLYNAAKSISYAATAFDISPNGKYFTSASGDQPYPFSLAFWGLWNLKNSTSLWNEQLKDSSPGIDRSQYAEHGRTWTAQLAFSPDSKKVALSGNLKHPALAVYNASNGHAIWAHPSDAPDSFVRHFDWSRNGHQLAVAMGDSKAKEDIGRWGIVDVKTGNVQHQFEGRGKLLSVAWCWDDTVLLARQTPDKLDKPRYDQPPREICYLELRNAKTGTLIRTNSQSFSSINTMTVSPNQKDVAVGYNDGSLRVWEIVTGKLKLDQRSQTMDIVWRGNHQIVTAEANDGVKFWSVPQQKLLATALFMYPWKKNRNKQQSIMDDAQWMIYTPDNYYDCSPGAEKYIRWRVGDKLLAADGIYKSTYHNCRKVMHELNTGL